MKRAAWAIGGLWAAGVLVGCSSGGDAADVGIGDAEQLPDPAVEVVSHAKRLPNPAVEGIGEVKNNTRIHRTARDGHKASVVVTGLKGELVATLGDERLKVTSDGETRFASTFPAGTEVVVDLTEQPFLQSCQIMGATAGVIENDRTLQFQVLCDPSYAPDVPVVTKIYSADVDMLDIEWEAPEDRNTPPGNISYRVHWALDVGRIEAGTANTKTVAAPQVSTQLTGLTPGTRYHVAVEAIDDRGLASPLSEVHPIETIATPNVLSGTPYHVLPTAKVTLSGSNWTVSEEDFENAPAVGDVLISDAGTSTTMVRVEGISMSDGVYTFSTSEASIADLFDHLTISSNMLLVDQGSLPAAQVSARSAPVVAMYKPSYPSGAVRPFSVVGEPVDVIDDELTDVGICRQLNLNISVGQTDQITFEPIRKFEIRGLNNLELDFLNQEIDGEYEFLGEAAIGAKFAFELVDSLSGTLTCDLKGLPVRKMNRHIISGIPIFQEMAFDSALKLTVDMNQKLTGSTQFVAKAYLSAKVFKDPDTGHWDASASEGWGYEQSNKLDYGAQASARLSIVPSVSTTVNEIATFTLSADAGANFRSSIQAIGEQHPVSDWRKENYLQAELSSEADVSLSVAAKLHWFDTVLAEYPETELYRTKPIRIFDTPRVCTNSSPSRENCITHEVHSQQVEKKKYDLQIHLIGGTNNPVDLSSIEWQVSPANGALEVDEDNPAKATFTPYDDEAYTIVASAHGVLGEAARKYATFAITGEKCRYGLGHELSVRYHKYLAPDELREMYPELVMLPLPAGTEIADPDEDFHEVCSFTFDQPKQLKFLGHPTNVRRNWKTNLYRINTIRTIAGWHDELSVLTVTYYAGQKNGESVLRLDTGETATVLFQEGYPVSRKYVYDDAFTSANYELFGIPGTDYKFSFMTSSYAQLPWGLNEEIEAVHTARIVDGRVLMHHYQTIFEENKIRSFRYYYFDEPIQYDKLLEDYDPTLSYFAFWPLELAAGFVPVTHSGATSDVWDQIIIDQFIFLAGRIETDPVHFYRSRFTDESDTRGWRGFALDPPAFAASLPEAVIEAEWEFNWLSGGGTSCGPWRGERRCQDYIHPNFSEATAE